MLAPVRVPPARIWCDFMPRGVLAFVLGLGGAAGKNNAFPLFFPSEADAAYLLLLLLETIVVVWGEHCVGPPKTLANEAQET